MSIYIYDKNTGELTKVAGNTVPNSETMEGATPSVAGEGGTVPQPLAGDQDKVLQGNGTWGKKLQCDVVLQNGVYGYINNSDTFIPFKSQSDIDAAVAAAKVGNATAADVRKGKTFTNASGSGLTGTLVIERFQAGRLKTTKNIDGWNDIWQDIIFNTPSGYLIEYGNDIWSDGENIYYSSEDSRLGEYIHIILNKGHIKTWKGLTEFKGRDIWTDGIDIYYSNGSKQYVLNKTTSTWNPKTWNGLTNFVTDGIWTDGTNIYYSYNLTQYVLDKATSTWSPKIWSGMTNFSGSAIWTDGTNIYHSAGDTYVLNKTTSTWSPKTWGGLLDFIYPQRIWTDGTNIYYSKDSKQYVLDKATSTWNVKTWSGGITSFDGNYIWTDGTNIYYSYLGDQYVLVDIKTHWTI